MEDTIEITKGIMTFLIRLIGVLFVLWLCTWVFIPLLIILFSIFAILGIYISRLSVKVILGLLLIGWLFCFFISPKTSSEINVDKIVNAIYLAEGGKKAQYPYGIRSIECSSEEECRQICINTVRNSIKRYNNYGHKTYSTFLEFLASRYCPIGVENDPKNLNQHWLKNVRYFLEKGVK